MATAMMAAAADMEEGCQGAAKEVHDAWIGAGKEMYSAGDLDVLALGFAVVKILYLEGQWLYLPSLLSVFEPTRVRSVMPLHCTNIRNEQAYYCCIAQLLAEASRSSSSPPPSTGPDASTAPPPPGPTASLENVPSGSEVSGDGSEISGGSASVKGSKGKEGDKRDDVVYVCGDSHTLTPSWKGVTVAGRRRVLRPALVTGLKHWHLRKEGTFYPKKNFEKMVSKIPKGSAVVFIFGEIDCREGILLAVEKMRYKTAEEGVEHTVAIFIKVAEKLAKERQLRVYVHPVVPVLAETRRMVKTYNRVFRRMVDKSKHLRWLDFFDQILDPTGDDLRPEFRLDGTHLAPAYTGLLEKALGDVWVEEAVPGGGGARGGKGGVKRK